MRRPARDQARQKTTDQVLRKSWQWLQFKCGTLRKLPAEFFESAPFTFALGGSFAFLGTQAADRLPVDREWVQNHTAYFHISELPRLERLSIALEKPRQVLASLSMDALKAVSNGDEIVLGDRFVLLRKPPTIANANGETSHLLGRTGTFSAFKRQDWDLALAKSHYKVDLVRGDQLCVLTEGQVCWRVGPDQVLRAIQFRTLTLFVFALVLTGLCAWIAIRKFREQQPEETVYRSLHALVVCRLLRFGEMKKSSDNEAQKRRLVKLDADLYKQNHFERLGVSQKAREAEVKRAYHELAKIIHPDKMGPDISPEVRALGHAAFAKVSEAYETLMNPTAKAQYLLELEKGSAAAILEAEGLTEQARQCLSSGDVSKGRELLERAATLARNRR